MIQRVTTTVVCCLYFFVQYEVTFAGRFCQPIAVVPQTWNGRFIVFAIVVNSTIILSLLYNLSSYFVAPLDYSVRCY